MENNENREVSFRGKPIPEVTPKSNFQVADSKQVIDKISKMDRGQQKSVTIDAIHYGDRGISEVKLTTGDIVPIETAIALAENRMLNGYSTGATPYGGRTLRTKPDTSKNRNEWNSIHSLPKF